MSRGGEREKGEISASLFSLGGKFETYFRVDTNADTIKHYQFTEAL